MTTDTPLEWQPITKKGPEAAVALWGPSGAAGPQDLKSSGSNVVLRLESLVEGFQPFPLDEAPV